MTLFATKQVNLADLDQVQSTIADLQRKLRAPPDLMMLSAETADPLKRDVYIGVPSALLLVAFPGFVEVAREALPNLLTPVVAQEDKFEALFPGILRSAETSLQDAPVRVPTVGEPVYRQRRRSLPVDAHLLTPNSMLRVVGRPQGGQINTRRL